MVQEGSMSVVDVSAEDERAPFLWGGHWYVPLISLLNMRAPTLHTAVAKFMPLTSSSRCALTDRAVISIVILLGDAASANGIVKNYEAMNRQPDAAAGGPALRSMFRCGFCLHLLLRFPCFARCLSQVLAAHQRQ